MYCRPASTLSSAWWSWPSSSATAWGSWLNYTKYSSSINISVRKGKNVLFFYNCNILNSLFFKVCQILTNPYTLRLLECIYYNIKRLWLMYVIPEFLSAARPVDTLSQGSGSVWLTSITSSLSSTRVLTFTFTAWWARGLGQSLPFVSRGSVVQQEEGDKPW